MLSLHVIACLCCQRSEIICHLAETLTERKEEILAANKMDMELAVSAGNRNQHFPGLEKTKQAELPTNANFPAKFYFLYCHILF